MADADIENGVRALVVLPSVTGLARDVVVNSFAFNKIPGGRPTDGDLDAVATALIRLYNEPDLAGHTMAQYLSKRISRSTAAGAVKLYRMDDAPPRPPYTVPFTVGPMSGSLDNPLPPECAVCLSFKCATKPGPRGRGRVYIGPLTQATITWGAVGEYHVTADVTTCLATAGDRLRTETGTANMPWQVYSTMDVAQHMHTVTSVWVDNEYDTVRKRGLRATTRTALPA